MGSQRVWHSWATELNWTDSGSIFNFNRILHTVFHSGCTRLQTHQQFTGFFSPHPHLHLLLFWCLFDYSHSNRYGRQFICISLKTYDVEHIFMYLLVFPIPYLGESFFRFLLIFNWGILFYWVVTCLFFISILYQVNDLQIFFLYQDNPHIVKWVWKCYLQFFGRVWEILMLILL